MNNENKIFLEELLEKELEYLRKRFKPYKRSKFLRNIVKIDIKGPEKENVVGFYENTKIKENQFTYIHNVFISESSMNYYHKMCKYKIKRPAIRKLRDIIRHELIHAFVFEEYEDWEKIKNCHGDYSPIFLSCLYWANAYSGHPYTNNFFNTDLFEKIKKCNNYDEIQTILMLYIFKIEEVVDEINKELHPRKELEVTFNLYGSGINKNTYLKQEVICIKDNKKEVRSVEFLRLGIGFLIDAGKLINGYDRKFNETTIAKYHSVEKTYLLKNNIKRTVTLISNIN